MGIWRFAFFAYYISLEQWLKGVVFIFFVTLLIIVSAKLWIDNAITDEMDLTAGIACFIAVSLTVGLVIPFITTRFFFHCY